MAKSLYAVYGSLRASMGNHRIISGATYLGTVNSEPKYTMHSYGSFPALIDNGDTSVILEVYEVEDEGMKRSLDNLEGYSGKDNPHNFYNRVEIDTEFGSTFLYLINEKHPNGEVVTSGDWVEYLTKKRG